MLLNEENKQESLRLFYKIAENSRFNDFYILADISLRLYHNGDHQMSHKLTQRSMISKEKGVFPKYLNNPSDYSKKYSKFSALGEEQV